jgi:outer membrane immunogenic protein
MRKLLGLAGTALLFAGPALAADLAVTAPVYKALPLPPVQTWTGWYVGLNAGYHFGGGCVGTTTTNVSSIAGLNGDIGGAVAAQGTGSTCPSDKGFLGGGQVGYNWQMTNFVTGIEADIQGASNSGGTGSAATSGAVSGAAFNAISTGTINSTKSLDWFGTLRARAGYLVTPAFLVYGTGGLAYGGVRASTSIVETLNYSDTPNPFGTNGSYSGTSVGWTAGGGLEWMFLPSWSLKAEYLYYDLGDKTFSLGNLNQTSTVAGLETVGASQSSVRFNGQIVRAGVNWHF